MSARTVGLVAALTAVTGLLAFIVFRKKGQDDEEPKQETKEVKIEANNENCKPEIPDLEHKAATEYITKIHHSEETDSAQKVVSKDIREIHHSEEAVKTNRDTASRDVSEEVSDMAGRTESLMEWIDRQLREAEMKTSGQWPSLETDMSTSHETRSVSNEVDITGTATLNQETLRESKVYNGKVEEVENNETADTSRKQTEQDDTTARNARELTELSIAERNRVGAEIDVEEISFKDEISEEGKTTEAIADKNPEIQVDASAEKVNTHTDETDSTADCSGQWLSLETVEGGDTETIEVEELVTDMSTSHETRSVSDEVDITGTATLNQETLRESKVYNGKVEEVKNDETADTSRKQTEQDDTTAQNARELTELTTAEKNRVEREIDVEEISFKDEISEADRTTEAIADKNPEIRVDASDEKVNTHSDEIDSTADVAKVHSNLVTERVGLVTYDQNGNISDSEIELLTEDLSETHREAGKLLEESESDSDGSSPGIVTAGDPTDNTEAEMEVGENCTNSPPASCQTGRDILREEEEAIILRPAWQRKVS